MHQCTNASLEPSPVTDESLTRNTSDTDHMLDRKVKLRKDMKVKLKVQKNRNQQP